MFWVTERIMVKKQVIQISKGIVKRRQKERHVIKPYEIAVHKGRILLSYRYRAAARISFENTLSTSCLIYGVIGGSNDPTTVYDSNDTSLLFLESRKFPSCCISLARMRRDGYTRLEEVSASAVR